jgi:heparan-alpha-glucosaminide N-acetyltransferase
MTMTTPLSEQTASLRGVRTRRLVSIDVFRAITMLLMIFVNDLVLDEKVPRWLEHAAEGEDRLGLADTVFPAFLFIVGLSIPFAIRRWQSKGMLKGALLGHILSRSFALLVMGIYAVNYEEYYTGHVVPGKFAWLLFATIAFFVIWFNYPESWSGVRKWAFRCIGILMLIVLAIVYKGGTPDHPSWMRTHWYGILGLIGWAYLCGALLYLYIGDRLLPLAVAALFCLGMSIANTGGWLAKVLTYREWMWFMDGGGLVAFTLAGVLTAVFYSRWTIQGRAGKSLLRIALLAPVLLAAGFVIRPLGGIAKLGVTPSWVLICSAISMAVFAILAYVVDLRGRQKWFELIRPAGTSTLMCYLLTYIHFAVLNMLPDSWRLPLALRTGNMGLVKSLIFSLLIVLLTGWLEKRKFRLSV